MGRKGLSRKGAREEGFEPPAPAPGGGSRAPPMLQPPHGSGPAAGGGRGEPRPPRSCSPDPAPPSWAKGGGKGDDSKGARGYSILLCAAGEPQSFAPMAALLPGSWLLKKKGQKKPPHPPPPACPLHPLGIKNQRGLREGAPPSRSVINQGLIPEPHGWP